MSAQLAPRLTLRAPAVVAQPVRVCFMIDRLSRAGTETQLLALIRSLDRTQVEPMLVLLDDGWPAAPAWVLNTVPPSSPRP